MRGDLERATARAFLERQGWDSPEHTLRAGERYLSRKYGPREEVVLQEMARGFCWVHALSEFVYRTPRFTPWHHVATCCPNDPEAWEGFLVGFLGASLWRVAHVRRPRTPHLAIVWAAHHGRGLHLTAEEVRALAGDDAILSAGESVAEGLVACTEAKGCPCYLCRPAGEGRVAAMLRVYEHRRQKGPGPKAPGA